MMWSQGLLYKCVPFEESVLVPLLLRWPKGLPAGRVCPTLVGAADLLPTLAGLLGWPCPQTVEGLNLAAGLKGQPGGPDPTSVFLSQYTSYVFRPDFPVPPWRGVRTARYTYAATADRKPWLFFDNERDPYQMTNLVNAPAYRDTARQLAAELEEWLRRIGDPFLPEKEMQSRFGMPYQWPEETAT
jgi:arylsulfatase A-like enzyme